MVRTRVGRLALRSAIIALVIAPALIAGMPVSDTDATPQSRSAKGPTFQRDQGAGRVDPSDSPATIPGSVEWLFSEPQPDWKSALPLPGFEPAALERTADALRVTLSERSGVSPRLLGGVYVDLPGWRREDWAEVLVSVRATSTVNNLFLGLDLPESVRTPVDARTNPRRTALLGTFQTFRGTVPVVRDGLIHTYRIHLVGASQPNSPWRRLGFLFEAPKPGSIDILSVRIVPATTEPGPDRVSETTLEPEQLKSDFALFRNALEEAHADLYRYTTKRDLDAKFARAESQLTRPMTILQLHNVLAPVRAAVKDGSGGLDFWFSPYQGDEIGALLTVAKQFPLTLTFESTRAYVVLNQGLDEHVTPGMEVLAINGESFDEILRRILPNLGQYGDGRTHQMYRLGIHFGFFRQGTPGRAGFSEAYRLYIGDPRHFRTTLRDPRTRKTVVVDLDGVTLADAAVNVEQNPVNRDVLAGIRTLRAVGPPQSIRYLEGEDTAVLVPAFGASLPAFLKEAFAELRRRGTKNLIIDMRGNTGGSAAGPPLLFSYLTSKEFRTTEHMRATTFQPTFKQHTAQDIDPEKDSYYGSAAGYWKTGPDGRWLATEKDATLGVQKPSENPFDGTVYVLIDGAGLSATMVFCSTADFHKRATFVGEETGGLADILLGTEESTSPTLPASRLYVPIPSQARLLVVDRSNRRRGVLPKYRVTQTVGDLAKRRDTVLEFTRELIRTGKTR